MSDPVDSPRNNPKGGSSSGGSFPQWMDSILSIIVPLFFVIMPLLSIASAFLKVNNVQFFVTCSLAGWSAWELFKIASDELCSGTNWSFSLRDWLLLSLVAYLLYFGLIHSLVTR